MTCKVYCTIIVVFALSIFQVSSACPDGCTTCDTYDKCTTCKPHKWGLTARCSYDCSIDCLNRECQDEDGYCTGCINGTYGQQCRNNCSLCQDGQCDLQKCTWGCKSGYYEYKTPTETFCQTCPSNCNSCNDSYVCNICNDGFHLYEFMSVGNKYVYCVQCPRGKSCKACKIQNESIVCTACYDGFELDDEGCTKLLSNVSACSSGCSSTCDENGACLGSCNAGWTGEKCTDLCLSYCLRCDKKNPRICDECHDDFYTSTCNVHCSLSCIKVSGQTTCGIHNGYCLNGCERKMWGNSCNMTCSNECLDDGLSEVCERDNGACNHGCADGYDGDRCETTMSTEQRGEFTRSLNDLYLSTTTHIEISQNCQNPECSFKTGFITGYFSGIGTCLVIAAVITVLNVVRRRYISKERKTFSSNEPTSHALQAQGTQVSETTMSELSNYESLGNRRNKDTDYSELASQSIQQSDSYYNVRITK